MLSYLRNFKYYLLFILLLTFNFQLLTFNSFAQGVGVNTDGSMPANSAVLDVKASDKGILIPRVSLDDTVDVATISSPDTSLIVHNTNATMDGGNGVGIYQWTGSKWVKLIAPVNGPGSNGDVLTSQGPAQAPAWKTASGGGGGCTRTKRIFTTSTTYNGNLGGIAGADTKCQTRADAAGLGGTWKAIVSIGNSNSPLTDKAKGRIGYDWDVLTNVHGVPLISSYQIWVVEDLSNGQFKGVALNMRMEFDEFGNKVSGVAWSGSTDEGEPSGNDCNDWTSNSAAFDGTYGLTYDRTANWISNTTLDCANNFRLYCVEQ